MLGRRTPRGARTARAGRPFSVVPLLRRFDLRPTAAASSSCRIEPLSAELRLEFFSVLLLCEAEDPVPCDVSDNRVSAQPQRQVAAELVNAVVLLPAHIIG